MIVRLISIFCVFCMAVPLMHGANLLIGDTSAETEARSLTEGPFGSSPRGNYSTWSLDEEQAFDGKRSIHVLKDGFNSTRETAIVLEKGKAYTASFYAKAPKNGIDAMIHAVPYGVPAWPLPKGAKTIRLTTEWQRFSLTFTAGSDDKHVIIYGTRTMSNQAWFDAFQLEEGNAATTYRQAKAATIGIRLQNVPGQIYRLHENPAPLIEVIKSNEQVELDMVRFRVESIDGQLAEEKLSLDSAGQARPIWRAQQPGWYRFIAEVIAAGKVIASDYLAFVVTPEIPEKHPQYKNPMSLCALYMHPETYVRMGCDQYNGAAQWSNQSAREGHIALWQNWEQFHAVGMKFKVLFDLDGPKRLWTKETAQAAKDYKLGQAQLIQAGPQDLAEWREFLKAFLAKYGNMIDIYEFGGEIDARYGLNPYYKNLYKDTPLDIYAGGKIFDDIDKMLRVAVEEVHKINPEAKITAVRPCDVDCRRNFAFSREVFRRGGDLLNCFGVDCYPRPRWVGKKIPLPGTVRDLEPQYHDARDLLKLSKDPDGDIFISEYGVAIDRDSAEDPEVSRISASFLAQAYYASRAIGYSALAWYQGAGPANTGEGDGRYFFSLWFNGSPLPAVGAYVGCATRLANTEKGEFVKVSKTVTAALFKKFDGTGIAAIWSETPDAEISFYMPAMSAYDMFGAKLTLPLENGKMRGELSYSPMIFESENYDLLAAAVKNLDYQEGQTADAIFRMTSPDTMKVKLVPRNPGYGLRGSLTAFGQTRDFALSAGESVFLTYNIKGAPGDKCVFTLVEAGMSLPRQFDWVLPEVHIVSHIKDVAELQNLPPTLVRDSSAYIFPIDVFGWSGIEDLAVNLKLAHDGEKLHLLAEVRDDRHFNSFQGVDIWKGDALQIVIDSKHECLPDGAGVQDDDSNFAFALASGQSSAYVYYGPLKAHSEKIVIHCLRDEDKGITTYAAQLPLVGLGIIPGKVFGLGGVVFDDDSNAKYDYYMELYPGIIGGVNPERFGVFYLDTNQ